MLPVHVSIRLKERGLNYSEIFLKAVARECPVDTAVVLDILDCPIPQENMEMSNGNLVILIVRDSRPITIFFRRSWNQPLTPEALDVREIKYYRKED